MRKTVPEREIFPLESCTVSSVHQGDADAIQFADGAIRVGCPTALPVAEVDARQLRSRTILHPQNQMRILSPTPGMPSS
jgi:hypothetical protein